MTRNVRGFTRITINPRVMAGKPCIRGMRVTVGMILGNLGAGVSIEEMLEGYPYLEREDILEAMRYGAWLAQARDPWNRPREIRHRHEFIEGLDPLLREPRT